jgi:hypothetical protein
MAKLLNCYGVFLCESTSMILLHNNLTIKQLNNLRSNHTHFNILIRI